MSKTIRTEHAGAKNGGGFWGHRHDAKHISAKARREAGRIQSNPLMGESVNPYAGKRAA